MENQVLEKCWSAALVSTLARELGLSPGNLWEPATVRRVEVMECALGREDTEMLIRFQLGLTRKAGNTEAENQRLAELYNPQEA